MDMTFAVGGFVAKPLRLDPVDGSPEAKAHAIWKSHLMLGRLAAHQHYFTDYSRGCAGECGGFCKDLAVGCKMVKHRVAAALLAKDAFVWEVWRNSVDFCGILRVSDVEPGCDAKAHYCFFDGRLKDKTPLLKAWRDWGFSSRPGWPALHRVTLEIPEDAFALAKHAVKHLGFGGGYTYRGLPVEGVRRAAKWINGRPLDLIILGYMA